MALLIPLLLPTVMDAAANIGIGISNAVQGTSSSVSLQIGKKVFTTNREFKWEGLPYELRQTILTMALEGSKDLILPAPIMFDPTRPMSAEEVIEIRKRNPLHPDNKNYRSIVGDYQHANGYPLSSWRWMGVCSEWRETLQPELWEECDVGGRRQYSRLLKMMNEPANPALRLIRTITLREGFASPADLYSILSNPNLQKLEAISILPDWPTPHHQLVEPLAPFNFGIQLVRTQRQIKSFTYGLPLEATTNQTSRQHLGEIRAPTMTVTFTRPTLTLFQELSDLTSEYTKTLRIRYVSTELSVDPTMFLCPALQSFEKTELLLHLPRPRRMLSGQGFSQTVVEDPNSPGTVFATLLISALESSPDEVRDRYSVWDLKGWEVSGGTDRIKRVQLWPVPLDTPDVLDEPVGGSERSLGEKGAVSEMRTDNPGRPAPAEGSTNGRRADWERQTELKLFGGLVRLSLESKKH